MLIAMEIVAFTLLSVTSALVIAFVIACDRATSTPLRVVKTGGQRGTKPLKRAA